MQISPTLPWRALLAVVVIVPLAVGAIPVVGTPLTTNIFVQAKLIALCVTLAVVLAAWGVELRSSRTVYAGPALIPMSAFLLAGAASAIFSINPRIAFFGDFEQGVGFVVLSLCVLTAFLTAQLVRDATRLRELTSVVLYTATGVAVVGLMQQIAAFDLVLGPYADQLPEWMLQRGYGTIGNADIYAAFLVLPALLAIHRFRLAEDTSRRLRRAGSAVVILTTLVIAQTRAPLAGLAVGVAAYAVAEWRTSRGETARRKPSRGQGKTSPKVVVATVIAVVVVGVLASTVFGTASDLGERFSLESIASLGGRLPLWRSAVDIAGNHPVLGVGPDSFRLGWYPVRPLSHLDAGASLVITDPHSVPLLIAATMGILGLAAAAYLVLATAATGARTLMASRSAKGAVSDYPAWFFGWLGLAVALLASLLATSLAFVLFLGIGVLLAPALQKRELGGSTATLVLPAASLLLSAALLAFGVVTAAAQLIAVGARTDDAQLDAGRAARASALAPWDTGLRNAKYETAVQAALEQVFTDQPDADAAVDRVADDLAHAADAEPHEYLHPYRSALVLIGSGPRLGDEFTRRGIDSGLRGLELYPNSVELRTGVASGYLALGETESAEAILRDYWNADAEYLQAGITYAQALIALDEVDEAREVLSELRTRFADDVSVRELEQELYAD